MSKAEAGMLDKVVSFATQFEIKKQEMEEDEFFVEGFASTSDLDDQGDIITFPALKKAAKSLLKDFTTALFNHDMDRPIGKVVEAEAVEGKGLRVKIQLSKAEAEIRRKVEEGIINKFSIRGRALKIERKFDEATDVMLFIIHEIELVEVSLVSIPANRMARVTGFERVVTSAKSLAGAIMKSFNDSEKGGGKETMAENKVVVKDEEVTPETPVTTPETPAAPAGEETPAAPVAPEAAEPAKPAEGSEVPEGDEEKSFRQLAGRMAAATGEELVRLKAEMTLLMYGKSAKVPAVAVEATPEGAKSVSLTVEQVTELVNRQVAASTAKRKGESVAPEVKTVKGEGNPEKEFDDYPLVNKAIVLCARIWGQEKRLR